MDGDPTVALESAPDGKPAPAADAGDGRYAAIFTAAPFDLVVVAVKPDGKFVYEELNPTHTRNTGITAEMLIGRTPEEVFGPIAGAFAVSRFRECLDTGRKVEYEVSTRMPAGEVVRRSILVPLRDAEGRIAKILLSSIDLTATRQIEAQLRRAQRLEAIGQLTGGVAHDFNNLLTAILGNLELLQRQPLDERGRARLAAAQQAARRGGQLTHQLLAYARRQPLPVRPVDVGMLLRGMLDLLHRSLGGMIEIELDVADDVWPASSDAAQLELAVLNLAINARDAMKQGGKITITASNAPREAQDKPTDLIAGEYVAVSVIDNGDGMTPAVIERAFDPFFTTKEIGKGTGLGLAQVDGLARQSGGAVQLTSTVGEGTTVTILLPRATQAAESTAAVVPTPDRTGVGSAAVLVVDDDEAGTEASRRSSWRKPDIRCSKRRAARLRWKSWTAMAPHSPSSISQCRECPGRSLSNMRFSATRHSGSHTSPAITTPCGPPWATHARQS